MTAVHFKHWLTAFDRASFVIQNIIELQLLCKKLGLLATKRKYETKKLKLTYNYFICTHFAIKYVLIYLHFVFMYIKIILLGITSKVCSAETSGNTDRTVTREDETKPPLLSAKRARLTVGSSGWLVSLMTVPLLPLWGAGGRGGILSGYG